MKALAGFLVLSLALGAVLLASVDRGHDDPPAPRASVVHDDRVTVHPVVAAAAAPPALHDPGPAPERNAAAAIADRRAQLEARFTEQRVDAGWADSAREQLRDDLGKHATDDVRVRAVECKASLCRVEVAAASHDAQQAFLESWAHARTWTGAGFAATDGDVLIVFLSRPGSELP